MNGTYLGKSYSGIIDIFTILEIAAEDRKWLFDLVTMIDTHRTKAIKDANPKK